MAKEYYRNEKPISIVLENMPAIHSEGAERALLGAILSHPGELIDRCNDMDLTPEDFFNPCFQELFRNLVEMHAKDIPIDLSTVMQHLDDRGLSDVTGGPALLGDLAAGVVTVLTAPAHIHTVKTKAIRRALRNRCAAICYECEEDDDINSLLDNAERTVFEITGRAITQTSAKSRQVASETLVMIENYVKLRGKPNGLCTGLEELDSLTTGFKAGEMIVLAAASGVGKTALALTMVKNFIKEKYNPEEDRFQRPGHSIGYFSLEMTRQQLMLRLIASMASVSLQKIRKGELSQSDMIALSSCAEEIADMPLVIDEASGITINQLRSKARRMKKEDNVEGLIIDYVGLLTSNSEKAKRSREAEMAEISRGIKALSLELMIPIIVLSQINRKGEEAGKPSLHHLRESAAIGHDADFVGLLSRSEVQGDDENPLPTNGDIRALLDVVKQRHGPTDALELLFRSAYTRFETLRRTAS